MGSGAHACYTGAGLVFCPHNLCIELRIHAVLDPWAPPTYLDPLNIVFSGDYLLGSRQSQQKTPTNFSSKVTTLYERNFRSEKGLSRDNNIYNTAQSTLHIIFIHSINFSLSKGRWQLQTPPIINDTSLKMNFLNYKVAWRQDLSRGEIQYLQCVHNDM